LHDTITYFFTKIIGEAVKKLLLLALLCNALIARPPHEVTGMTRPSSPLMPDLELCMRVTRLIKERRNAMVHPLDSTLVAILEVYKNMRALAAFGQNQNITIEDLDIRFAIKYIDNESLKTKIL
jgi:hypothetical protein